MIKFTETILRDGQQSLIAAKMKTEDILPALEKMDNIGYYSIEMWGGATFYNCLKYLDEDPWLRLGKINMRVKKTSLQMLLHGQNILGYKHYPDDVLKKFIARSIDNGISIIRIFDALNDVRNMKKAIQYTSKYSAHAQGTIIYSISPIHNIDYYLKTAKSLQEIGADSICLKDMAGLLTPYRCYKLIKKLKKELDVPIQLHSHNTGGMAFMTYLKGIEAGVDIIDTAISPFSSGTSQPTTETMLATLTGTDYAPNINLKKIDELSAYFREIRNKYKDYLESFEVDPRIITHQLPVGMLSNLHSQLKEQGMPDKYNDVLKEVPRVREEMGYPPLVTPISQIVGTQAVFNVISKERYSLVSSETREYVRGMYGRPPGEINNKIKEKILGDKEQIMKRPADLIPPRFAETLASVSDFVAKEEDVLSYILFPEAAECFLKKHY